MAAVFLFWVSVADWCGVWYTGFKLFVEILSVTYEMIRFRSLQERDGRMSFIRLAD